jgi:hypothetical protein
MAYLQDQAVMNFAGTAARGSAIGTAVSEGMVSYLADSNVVQAYDGSAWNSLAYQSAVSAIPRVGLVPVVPTSITTTSGTASYNSTTGLITLAGCGDPIINGVFTSAYKNYRLIINLTPSVNGATSNPLFYRFATGGTTNSTSNYTYTNWYTQAGVNGNQSGSGTGYSWGVLGYFKDAILEIGQPANASTGSQVAFTGYYTTTLMLGQAGLNVNSAVDGIQFANNFYTGTVQVYGYN